MKLLIGGSPCTHWSIAQTKSRETKPEGLGWELFKNYLIALEKFKPDFFLYENNKSMSPTIQAQITKELGVEPILINSALVSAQNRQRLYWTNIPDVEQPDDRGILLRDILESSPAGVGRKYPHTTTKPIRVGTMPNAAGKVGNSQSRRIYSIDGKSPSVCASQSGGNCDISSPSTRLYAVPCAGRMVGRRINADGHRDDYNENIQRYQRFELNANPQKTNCLSTVEKDNLVIEAADGKAYPVYEVRDGQITIKEKQYPIKLGDGYYIIRKLTVTECKRLQTVPESYVFPVSDTQAYRMLGNGWTVDVIAHILHYAPDITEEPLEVLSMYDGMSCGRLALNKLGANVTRYYATEIDKYTIQTTQHNFPDTIQLGDAFQVRDDGWTLLSS